MRECPGTYFASEPAGRTAKIAGTGLAVWEVLRDYVQDQDIAFGPSRSPSSRATSSISSRWQPS
jgi:hypothetical protein